MPTQEKIVPMPTPFLTPDKRYIRQSQLMKMMNLNYRDIKHLESAGLKRARLSPNSRLTFYDLVQFDEVMAKLAY